MSAGKLQGDTAERRETALNRFGQIDGGDGRLAEDTCFENFAGFLFHRASVAGGTDAEFSLDGVRGGRHGRGVQP